MIRYQLHQVGMPALLDVLDRRDAVNQMEDSTKRFGSQLKRDNSPNVPCVSRYLLYKGKSRDDRWMSFCNIVRFG